MFDLEDLKDVVVVLLVALATTFVIVAFAFAIERVFDKFSCATQTEAMGLKSSWGVFQGCMVQTGDEILPLSTYLERKAKQGMEINVTNK